LLVKTHLKLIDLAVMGKLGGDDAQEAGTDALSDVEN
jgi:hypothetical protein